MANQYVNKVIFGDQTLIDLTGDDVAQAYVLTGKKFHAPNGAQQTGTCTYDADTSDATATAAEILSGKTAYKNGAKLTGTMANVGAQTGTISTKAQQVSITAGYHDGSGTVGIDSTEQQKIVANNIKNGVQILGVTGTYTGSELIKATTLAATPYVTSQTILPSSLGDYDYFTQATIAAISRTDVDNAAGGVTVTIGSVAPSV